MLMSNIFLFNAIFLLFSYYVSVENFTLQKKMMKLLKLCFGTQNLVNLANKSKTFHLILGGRLNSRRMVNKLKFLKSWCCTTKLQKISRCQRYTTLRPKSGGLADIKGISQVEIIVSFIRLHLHFHGTNKIFFIFTI